MIATSLLVCFLGSLGLAVHLVGDGAFGEALKALTASGGIFTLLALRVGFFRTTHRGR